jgi:hypothetical protein
MSVTMSKLPALLPAFGMTIRASKPAPDGTKKVEEKELS